MLNVFAFSFYLKLEDYTIDVIISEYDENNYSETRLPTVVLESAVLPSQCQLHVVKPALTANTPNSKSYMDLEAV